MLHCLFNANNRYQIKNVVHNYFPCLHEMKKKKKKKKKKKNYLRCIKAYKCYELKANRSTHTANFFPRNTVQYLQEIFPLFQVISSTHTKHSPYMTRQITRML